MQNQHELLWRFYLHPLDQAIHQECVLRECLVEDLQQQNSYQVWFPCWRPWTADQQYWGTTSTRVDVHGGAVCVCSVNTGCLLTVNMGVVSRPQAKNSRKITTTACVTLARPRPCCCSRRRHTHTQASDIDLWETTAIYFLCTSWPPPPLLSISASSSICWHLHISLRVLKLPFRLIDFSNYCVIFSVVRQNAATQSQIYNLASFITLNPYKKKNNPCQKITLSVFWNIQK